VDDKEETDSGKQASPAFLAGWRAEWLFAILKRLDELQHLAMLHFEAKKQEEETRQVAAELKFHHPILPFCACITFSH
jgi:hypothetical protein